MPITPWLPLVAHFTQAESLSGHSAFSLFFLTAAAFTMRKALAIFSPFPPHFAQIHQWEQRENKKMRIKVHFSPQKFGG